MTIYPVNFVLLKKFVLLVFVTLVSTGLLQAQPPWRWAKQAAISGASTGLLCAGNHFGSFVVAGENHGEMVFGSDTLKDHVFLAAFDSLGTFKWLRPFPGLSYVTSLDYYQDIIMCGGTTTDTAMLDSFKIPPNSGFVAKYSNSGNLLWLKIHHGARPAAIKHAYGTDIFVTGNYSHAAIDHVRLESNGLEDIYVARYSGDGRLLWVETFGGKGNDQAVDLSALVYAGWDDYVILTGISGSDSVLFGANLLLNAPPTFIAGLNSAGDVNWVFGGYGAKSDNPLNIKFDYHRNFYISGQLTDTTTFTFNGISVKGNGKGDYYLLKIDSLGNPIWLKNSGSANKVMIGRNMMDVSEYGNVYIAGFYSGSWKFGRNDLPEAAGLQMYIAKYSPWAVPVWARAVGNNMDSVTAGAIKAKDFYGDVVLTGALTDTCYFNKSQLILSNEHPQFFIAKLYDPAYSLKGLKAGPPVQVFPNPSHNEIQVRLKDPTIRILSLYLMDIQGRRVMNGDHVSGRLDVSPLPKGVYMGCLMTGQHQNICFRVLVD